MEWSKEKEKREGLSNGRDQTRRRAFLDAAVVCDATVSEVVAWGMLRSKNQSLNFFFSNFFIAFDYRDEDNKNKRNMSMNIFYYYLFLKKEDTFDLL